MLHDWNKKVIDLSCAAGRNNKRPASQPSGKQKSKRPSGGKGSIVKLKSSSPLALGIGQPGAPVRATQSAGLYARSGGELADTPLEPTAEGWVEHTRGAH